MIYLLTAVGLSSGGSTWHMIETSGGYYGFQYMRGISCIEEEQLAFQESAAPWS
jgi:hypothetical protein